MPHRVCPWWIGYFLASPLRKLRQDPHAILSPFVTEGMVVLEPGPGMGFFTLELARLVGASGRVVAVDVQPKMLNALRRRARRAQLSDRIDARQAPEDGMGLGDLAGQVDFALAFAMVHEVPDAARFLAEVSGALKPGARLLLAEPKGHVSEPQFAATLELAARSGLRLESQPVIRASHAALLVKP
jgi:ubiquinone/menaquinone biosynthesis C-methylase UbiE